MQKFFEQEFIDFDYQCFGDRLKAAKIENLSGEASIIVSRGKRKIGYELDLKVKFEGIGELAENEVSFSFSNLCDDGSDPDFKVYVTKEKDKNFGKELKK